jgi:transposase
LPCNGFVVTAPGAPKVVEKGQYGASFLAHLAVSKCADHTPIYRLEKAFQRQGIPVARSTMNELHHRASAILAPVWTRLLDVVRVRHVVAADETRLRIVRDKKGKTKNGFVWTFGARDHEGGLDIAYVRAHGGAIPLTRTPRLSLSHFRLRRGIVMRLRGQLPCRGPNGIWPS